MADWAALISMAGFALRESARSAGRKGDRSKRHGLHPYGPIFVEWVKEASGNGKCGNPPNVTARLKGRAASKWQVADGTNIVLPYKKGAGDRNTKVCSLHAGMKLPVFRNSYRIGRFYDFPCPVVLLN
ncbi:MAG: hypothetical protein ACLUOI_12600 [Eisenbergiella sp.]